MAKAIGTAPGGVREQEARTAEKREESAPGSRRGSAGGTGRGGRPRVPAHPACDSGSSAGGGGAAPSAVLGTTAVSWQWGQEARNWRDESSRPSPDLEAPTRCSAPSARDRRERGLDAPASSSACGVHSGRALPAPIPPRSPLSGPPNGERSALPLCPGYPRRPSNTAGAISLRGSSLPQFSGTQKPEDGRKGQRAGSYRNRQ